MKPKTFNGIYRLTRRDFVRREITFKSNEDSRNAECLILLEIEFFEPFGSGTLEGLLRIQTKTNHEAVSVSKSLPPKYLVRLRAALVIDTERSDTAFELLQLVVGVENCGYIVLREFVVHIGQNASGLSHIHIA